MKIDIEKAVEQYREYLTFMQEWFDSEDFQKLEDIGQKYQNNPQEISEEDLEIIRNAKFPNGQIPNDNWLWITLCQAIMMGCPFEDNNITNYTNNTNNE